MFLLFYLLFSLPSYNCFISYALFYSISGLSSVLSLILPSILFPVLSPVPFFLILFSPSFAVGLSFCFFSQCMGHVWVLFMLMLGGPEVAPTSTFPCVLPRHSIHFLLFKLWAMRFSVRC